jgi:hypothetical protein
MKRLYFFSIFLLSISSCIIEPDECLPPSYASFSIVNKENLSADLVSSNRYSADSIRLIVDNKNIIKSYENNIGIDFLLDVNSDLSIYNDSTYYLYLNWTDVDTLKINAIYTDDPCVAGKYSLINTIIHNGTDTSMNFSNYKILK